MYLLLRAYELESCQAPIDPGRKWQPLSTRNGFEVEVMYPPPLHYPRVRRFGVHAVTKKGKPWWKKHTETTYFSDACINRDSLAWEFPRILRQIQELHMEFIFVEPRECKLHMVREFYANWATKSRSHFVKVRGLDVPLTPVVINDKVGTSQDTDALVLIGLNIRPPYRSIQHAICGPQSMVQWTKHSGKRYHQSLPYAHMLREARV
ncbi:hypothetical protein H5410_056196 [Solanum commersonii]|uniref:Putative plant transposon protein domain-containing protein n=1 Tax=Solanum commersonii TaxID=4109 RepID=A0A9J5WME4_SOLCO|nr:hypothetical protein H5410_056196 [Solanum commersonii]